jgi:hypothetical protein
MRVMKTAVIYHYCEINSYYKENLIYFLSVAIHDRCSYFIYISGACTVELPHHENVEFIYIENKNYDFGGVVDFYKSRKFMGFDAYVFINSSVRGPFLPNYMAQNWDEVFTSRLSNTVGLVGSSINLLPIESRHSKLFKNKFRLTEPYIHVQTCAYALSVDSYKVLASKGFFNVDEILEKDDLINRYEILLSQILIRSNYSISAILPTYEKFTINSKDVKINKTAINGDVLYRNAFYGRSLSPFEALFIKTNRNMISEKELASYTFTGLVRKFNDQNLLPEGVELFNKSSRLMIEKEGVKITPDQLILILKNIKQNNPSFAEELKKWI